MSAASSGGLLGLAKAALASGLRLLLGRRNLVRLSRFLSNEARLDGRNDFSTNGERKVQESVLRQAVSASPVVVLDVGANVGLWTRALLEQPGRPEVRIQVHAFEPCGGTFGTLQSNLRSWNLAERVVANRLALSSSRGPRTLFSLGDNEGRNGLHPLAGGAGQKMEPVDAETVDEYCRRRGILDVSLMKVDTEGHDLEVILGAREMIAAGRIGAIQFEYNHRWVDSRHYLRDAFEFFAPCGYSVGKVTRKGIEFYPGWHIELETFREANFLAAKASLVPSFPRVRWWYEGEGRP